MFPPHFAPQRHTPATKLPPDDTSIHSYESTVGTKSSLDFTQRIERKLADYNASQNVWKRWLFEIACWLISAASFGAIVGIYVHANHERSADWSKLLNFANILSKVISAALIVPTTEALGQLKWNWFHDSSKDMWDFEIFDKATRGPWGAAMLLFRTKGRSLTALGAFLIVLLLVIDSFLQQVVDLPERWRLQDDSIAGILSRTVRYEPKPNLAYVGDIEFVTDSPDLFAVTRKFSYTNGQEPLPLGNSTQPEVPVVSEPSEYNLRAGLLTKICTQSCPTSNCTWPIYKTLGACSKCADISSYLTFTCLDSKVDWLSDAQGRWGAEWEFPIATHCGFFLNATTDQPILMSGYLVQANGTGERGEALIHRNLPLITMTEFTQLYGNGSLMFKEFRNTITDTIIVSSPDGTAQAVYQNKTPIAQECVLTWCVKTIKSSFAWGRYTEEIIDTQYNTTTGPHPWDAVYTIGESENYTDVFYKEAVNIEVDSTLYGVSNSTASQAIMGFRDIFPAMTTAKNTSATPRLHYELWTDGDAHSYELVFNPWLSPNNVTRHMERLAAAFTSTIRSTKSSQISLYGSVYAPEIFIRINWGWLAFPLTLLLLSLVFLVSTIIKTSNDITGAGLWKTSAMPTLIYGLPKETQDKLVPTIRNKAQRKNKKTRIKLSPRMGWRVSGQSFRQAAVLPSYNNAKAPPGWI